MSSEPPATVWAARLGWAALLFGLAHVLLAAGRLLPFASPWADDICRAGQARQIGVGPAVALTYRTLSGRWSGVGLALALGRTLDPDRCYPWLLLAANLALPASAYALLSQAFAGRLSRRTRAVLSLGLLALYWDGMPSPQQSWYWLTGVLENQLSISFGLLLMAGLIRAARVGQPALSGAAAGLAALAVVAVGMHELYGAYLCALVLLGTALAYRIGSPGRGAWAVVAVAAVLGLAVVVLAPGNAARLGHQGARHTGASLAMLARGWAAIARAWLLDPKVLLATLLLVGHPRASQATPEWLRRHRVGWAAAAVLLTVGLLAGVILVNWWTKPHLLPGRTQSAIYLLFLLGWFAAAYALLTLPVPTPRPVWAVLAGGFALALVGTGNVLTARADLAGPVPEFYRRAMRERDRLLRAAVAAGDRNPRVPPIVTVPKCFPFVDISDDPSHAQFGYVNMHYCLYYGLESIGFRPPTRVAATAPRGDEP